jgi:uncharacterized protein (TIGR00369 family)
VVPSAPSLGCALFNQLSYRFVDPPSGGDAAVELDVTDDVRGPSGPVHAGVIAALADVAGAMAVVSRTGRTTVTSAVSVHNLAAARVGPLMAVATTLRVGRASALADVHVHDAGAGDRLVAAGHITITLLPQDPAEGSAV